MVSLKMGKRIERRIEGGQLVFHKGDIPDGSAGRGTYLKTKKNLQPIPKDGKGPKEQKKG